MVFVVETKHIVPTQADPTIDLVSVGHCSVPTTLQCRLVHTARHRSPCGHGSHSGLAWPCSQSFLLATHMPTAPFQPTLSRNLHVIALCSPTFLSLLTR